MDDDFNKREVLFGRRPPKTKAERDYLRFMGGIQDEPPRKRIACTKCNLPFEADGFPFPSGKVFYPLFCPDCRHHQAEVRKADLKPKCRNPHND